MYVIFIIFPEAESLTSCSDSCKAISGSDRACNNADWGGGVSCADMTVKLVQQHPNSWYDAPDGWFDEGYSGHFTERNFIVDLASTATLCYRAGLSRERTGTTFRRQILFLLFPLFSNNTSDNFYQPFGPFSISFRPFIQSRESLPTPWHLFCHLTLFLTSPPAVWLRLLGQLYVKLFPTNYSCLEVSLFRTQSLWSSRYRFTCRSDVSITCIFIQLQNSLAQGLRPFRTYGTHTIGKCTLLRSWFLKLTSLGWQENIQWRLEKP